MSSLEGDRVVALQTLTKFFFRFYICLHICVYKIEVESVIEALLHLEGL